MKAHKVNKPMKGHFDKANVAPKKTLREFRFEDVDAYNVGDILKADVFAAGDKVDVTGTSKGKGYAGVIKRWNFQRLKSHTVQVRLPDTVVLWVLVQVLQEYGRVRKWQVTWVQKKLQYRT